MKWWNDFKLGLAGTADVIEHSVGIDAHHAADLWAEQTAATQAAAEKLSPEQTADRQAQLNAEAIDADQGGAITDQALTKTADQVIAAAGDLGSSLKRFVIGGLVVAGIVGAAVIVSKLAPSKA